MNLDSLILYENVSEVLTLSGVVVKKGRHTTEKDLGIIKNASAVINSETQNIEWLGEKKDLPKEFEGIVNSVSCEGEIWLPELVECHTHLTYAGHRHHDYALRCAGKTYQQVAEEGGGIVSTMAKTREASFEKLLQKTLLEIDRFQKYGIGTIEVKSGYGLTLESEIKILQCIDVASQETSVNLVSTFMPAHAIPPEFKGREKDYVDVICKEWIPEVANRKLARFFDVFTETGYFTLEQTRRMLDAALSHRFQIKLHADQFTDIGGTSLGLEMGATSIDHLDHISEDNIKKFGNSDTVAVLLPGASLFTGTPYPPARKLIDAGARVALSTDYNPGTSPCHNLPLMTTLACSQMKMTIPEAIAGVTYNAAAALGLEEDLGSLQVGKPFRVCQLKAESYEVLAYSFGELE
jgi:imidazolonepropionase